jgi:prevent-host-death family protein
MSINVYEAKTQLSKLLARVEQGEEIVIARAGRPVARLVPVAGRPGRVFGQDRGGVVVHEGFDDDLSGLFEDGSLFPR